MTENVKLYIGKCIKKYRKLNFTQEELADGICSKYTLKEEEVNAEKKMLAFMNKYIPKLIGKDNTRLPLINLFRREIIQLVEVSFCYHSALIFDALIKKYTNEKEYQI